MKTKTKITSGSISVNKKALHEYFIEQKLEAGIVLEGWEVKSLRAGRLQITESHIILKRNEAWLLGAQIQPLATASTHVNADPTRTRKLLLNRSELKKLIGSVERDGYTLIPLAMYWKNNRVKIEIAVAKGKKLHDKRDSEKEREWSREKERVLKSRNRV
jgi:SsrA-binding protein